jgi:uncharacterized iron-regulated protein
MHRISFNKKFMILAFPLLLAFVSGDKMAYQYFTGDGRKTSYREMFDDLSKADVILFGELHNNAISHWMELELASDLWLKDSASLIMGAEMFERDQQPILDEYLKGLIRDRDFEAGTKLWDNYKTDYKPIVNFAFEKKIPFVATNIPRRYAALVNAKGFEGLDALPIASLGFVAPLPVAYDPELSCYKEMLAMGGGGMHGNANLPKAQAVKDATMAWSIAEKMSKGKRFFHFNGSYHSDQHEGIVWYLNKYKPGLKVLTISTIEQGQLDSLESASKGIADYILIVNERVTKTY